MPQSKEIGLEFSTGKSDRKGPPTQHPWARPDVQRRGSSAEPDSGSGSSCYTVPVQSRESEERAHIDRHPEPPLRTQRPDAGEPRRLSAPARTTKQETLTSDQDTGHDGEEQSSTDAELEGEELELIAELGFTVLQRNDFGRLVAQRHWIVLDNAQIKRVKFLRDKRHNIHQLAAEGLEEKVIHGTGINRGPANEELRPAFVALFDYCSELQEKCTEQQRTMEQLRDAVGVFQSIAPKSPEWIMEHEDAGQYGLHYKLKKQQREIVRLKEQFDKQGDSQRVRAIDDLQGEVRRLNEKLKALNDDNQKLMTQLQSSSRKDAHARRLFSPLEVNTSNGNTEKLWAQLQSQSKQGSHAGGLLGPLEVKPPSADPKNRSASMLKEIALARKEKRNWERDFEEEHRRANNLEKQAQALRKQQDLCAEQRDRFRDICRDNLHRLKQIAEWQKGQQKAQQIYFENKLVKAFNRSEEAEAAGNAQMPGAAAPHNQRSTMDYLNELRKHAAPSGMFKQENPYSREIVKANRPSKKKKKKPTPIHAPSVPADRLPDVSRSPKELEGLPPPQTGRLIGQKVQHQWSQAPSPAFLTSLWEDYAKTPLHFGSRAAVTHDIIAFDTKLQKHSFKQDARVFVFQDSMKDFWPVKRIRADNEPQYLLHRTALRLICSHGHEYKDTYHVIETSHLVTDDGEPLQLLERGQIAECAHSANTGSAVDGSLMVIRCVQSQDRSARGWVQANVLEKSDHIYTTGSTRVRGEQCPCKLPEPYTGVAIVLNNCSAVDGAFSLKKGDCLDLAHEGRPSNKGLLCVKDRRTGRQGYVAAIDLRVLRLPIAVDHELMLDLTPTYLPVTSENWIEGEAAPFVFGQRQTPARGWFQPLELPFSLGAKQAWEKNIQGTNPLGLTWADAEARSRPMKVMSNLQDQYFDHGKYITRADEMTAGLGPDLPRNPYGPATGPHRARSLSAFDIREKRILKMGPHIGYQPARKSLGDSNLPDRGYDSEAVTAEARSRINRSVLYKKVNGKIQAVTAGNDVNVHDLELWLDNGGDIAKYTDRPEGSHGIVTARYNGGSRYARGFDFVPEALAWQKQENLLQTPKDLSATVDDISQDESMPENEALTEGAPTCWVGAADLELLPKERWSPLGEVLGVLEESDEPPAVALSSPANVSPASAVRLQQPPGPIGANAASERPQITEPHPVLQEGGWDILFPVRETQSYADPRLVRVDTDDHVHLEAKQGDGYYLCEVYAIGQPRQRGLIHEQFVDLRIAEFPLCNVQCDLGMSSNWVIVLKRKSDMIFVGLPDRSKRWFYEDELPLDLEKSQIVDLQALLRDGMLQVDDPKPTTNESAKMVLRHETMASTNNVQDQPRQEAQQSLNDLTVMNTSSARRDDSRAHRSIHQSSAPPQPEASSYPSPPLLDKDGLSLGSENALPTSQNNSKAESRRPRRAMTLKEAQQSSWSFDTVPTRAHDAQVAPDKSPARDQSADGKKRAPDHRGHHEDSAERVGGENLDHRLVVPYKDYKEIKDANETRPNTIEDATSGKSSSELGGGGGRRVYLLNNTEAKDSTNFSASANIAPSSPLVRDATFTKSLPAPISRGLLPQWPTQGPNTTTIPKIFRRPESKLPKASKPASDDSWYASGISSTLGSPVRQTWNVYWDVTNQDPLPPIIISPPLSETSSTLGLPNLTHALEDMHHFHTPKSHTLQEPQSSTSAPQDLTTSKSKSQKSTSAGPHTSTASTYSSADSTPDSPGTIFASGKATQSNIPPSPLRPDSISDSDTASFRSADSRLSTLFSPRIPHTPLPPYSPPRSSPSQEKFVSGDFKDTVSRSLNAQLEKVLVTLTLFASLFEQGPMPVTGSELTSMSSPVREAPPRTLLRLKPSTAATVKATVHIIYLSGLIYLALGLYFARAEWLSVNGLDRGVKLVRSQRASQYGGWEWGPWEVLKEILWGLAGL